MESLDERMKDMDDHFEKMSETMDKEMKKMDNVFDEAFKRTIKRKARGRRK